MPSVVLSLVPGRRLTRTDPCVVEAMSIVVTCSGCQKQWKCKDELAGKRVKCPSCGQVLGVSASAGAAAGGFVGGAETTPVRAGRPEPVLLQPGEFVLRNAIAPRAEPPRVWPAVLCGVSLAMIAVSFFGFLATVAALAVRSPWNAWLAGGMVVAGLIAVAMAVRAARGVRAREAAAWDAQEAVETIARDGLGREELPARAVVLEAGLQHHRLGESNLDEAIVCCLLELAGRADDSDAPLLQRAVHRAPRRTLQDVFARYAPPRPFLERLAVSRAFRLTWREIATHEDYALCSACDGDRIRNLLATARRAFDRSLDVAVMPGVAENAAVNLFGASYELLTKAEKLARKKYSCSRCRALLCDACAARGQDGPVNCPKCGQPLEALT